MSTFLGAISFELHLKTPTGGPIIIGEGQIGIPIRAVSGDRGSATLTVDSAVLRHELAGVFIEAARQIEHSEHGA